MNKLLINILGDIIALIGIIGFACSIISFFVAPLWLAIIVFIIDIGILSLSFHLWDIAEI